MLRARVLNKKSLFILIVVTAMIMLTPTVFSAKSTNLELHQDDTIVLNAEVNAESVDGVIARINELNQLSTSKPIILVIASPGGSIIDGLRLIDYAKGSRRRVDTVTLYGYSMGFQIMQSLGTRYVVSSSNIMSHKARGGVQGEFGGTLDGQLVNRLSMWLKIVKSLDENTVNRTNGKMTYDDYIKAYENEMWVYGKETIEKGLADSLTTVTCGKDLNGTHDQLANFFGLTITVTWSNCPLLQNPLSVKANVKTNKGDMSYEEFKNRGGLIGGTCYTNLNNLCLINSELTNEGIENYKKQAKNQFFNKSIVTYTELGK